MDGCWMGTETLNMSARDTDAISITASLVHGHSTDKCVGVSRDLASSVVPELQHLVRVAMKVF